MRKYRAFWDNGHDFGDFEFYSFHRKNSKLNLNDAQEELLKKYGYHAYKTHKIISVELVN